MVVLMSEKVGHNSADLGEGIYRQLKSLARQMMTKERANHTLSATDLVHEAFVKLSVAELSFSDQKHHFQTFARQMRRVLVNYSYHKNSQKNQGEAVHFTDALGLVDGGFVDFNAINRAIDRLEQLDQRSAQCIELTYFTDLSQAQAAEYMGISLATLERDLKFGRVIIHEYIDQLHPS